jgi:hypothetical protein
MTATSSEAGSSPAVNVVDVLTRDFLVWVAASRRSYAETMEAWRTNCPRFPIWENAVDDGLVRVEPRPGGSGREPVVVLTPRGQAILAGE